ncbi:hypothetical protein F2Q68_00006883 [Brassica cretica]|uniref:LOB domain-containing protein n=2 Tax=Brassica cretica TaxID=69181 RepID=A0ABQ7C9F0_BRACR|nr:hypothetical protein F2Q68_00006883 [Brassica cretica]KAF3548348.1 hypothetical protein DY000_02010542 [Brassica cretica]
MDCVTVVKSIPISDKVATNVRANFAKRNRFLLHHIENLAKDISTAQIHYQKANVKPISNQQRDKQELPLVKTRAQGCCVVRTEKHPLQLGNRYSLLSVAI